MKATFSLPPVTVRCFFPLNPPCVQVKEAADKLQRTKNEIARLVRTMRQIPRTDPRGEKGKKLKGKEADSEREDMRRQALEEKENLEVTRFPRKVWRH